MAMGMMETVPAEIRDSLAIARLFSEDEQHGGVWRGAGEPLPLAEGSSGVLWGTPAAATTSASTGSDGKGDLLPAAQLCRS